MLDKRRPRSYQPVLLAMGLAIGLASCQSDRMSGPPDTRSPTSTEIDTCGARCVLTNTNALWSAVLFRPDSASATLFLAEVRVAGQAGEVVTLALETDTRVFKAIGPAQRVLISVDGGPTQAIAIQQLAEPKVVYRFTQSGIVTLRYSLDRQIHGTIEGESRLVQHVSGRVQSSTRPWFRAQAEASFLLAPTGDCPIAAASGTVCSVGYSVSPFVSPGFAGATFQSDAGSGPSHPITVTFQRAVKSVTVTIYDPDYAGNRIVAYDVNGTALQTVNFTGDNWPGVLTTETQVLAADGIRRVDLIPSTGIHEGDLVAYDMNFSPDSICDPLYADPILEAANVRSALNQEYTDGLQQGKERGGWIYQNNTTGEYLVEPELNPGNRDACEFTTPAQVPPKAGYTGVGSYHTHVLSGGQTAPAGCLNVAAGTPILNGPSSGDKYFPTQSGVPDYMLDEDQLFTVDQLGNVAPQPWTRDNFCRS